MMYVYNATMFTTCLDFGSKNIREISAWLPRPGCSHGVSILCMCVQISSLHAAKCPALPLCMQLTLVSWYVASTLCCHCWMFSLSDALPMQSYPIKIWVLFSRRPCRSLCGITYLFSFLPIYVATWNRWYIMANTLKMLTSWLWNVQFTSWIWFST